jgi:hypothetical protein
MTKLPRHSRYRPHFMAPGPYVEITDDKAISFGHKIAADEGDVDDDEDFVPYHYYRSEKILGKLFDAINEHDIFRVVQRQGLEQSFRQTTMGLRTAPWIVFHYVLLRTPHNGYQRYLDRARGIRDQ